MSKIKKASELCLKLVSQRFEAILKEEDDAEDKSVGSDDHCDEFFESSLML
jgi:hypothetical protein